MSNDCESHEACMLLVRTTDIIDVATTEAISSPLLNNKHFFLMHKKARLFYESHTCTVAADPHITYSVHPKVASLISESCVATALLILLHYL